MDLGTQYALAMLKDSRDSQPIIPFATAEIDRAIVLALYDLNGYESWFGGRNYSNKRFSMIPGDLVLVAAGYSRGDRQPAVRISIDPLSDNTRKFRLVCKQFAGACDYKQKEIIREIIKRLELGMEERRNNDPNVYTPELSKLNYWGKVMLCLAEAFWVVLEPKYLVKFHRTDEIAIDEIVRRLLCDKNVGILTEVPTDDDHPIIETEGGTYIGIAAIEMFLNEN